MGFSRQGYWSRLPFPSPEALPNPGIKPWPPALQTDSLLTELQVKPVFLLVGLYIPLPIFPIATYYRMFKRRVSRLAWNLSFLVSISMSKHHALWTLLPHIRAFKVSPVKNPPVNAGDAGSIPGSERAPGGGNGNPFQRVRHGWVTEHACHACLIQISLVYLACSIPPTTTPKQATVIFFFDYQDNLQDRQFFPPSPGSILTIFPFVFCFPTTEKSFSILNWTMLFAALSTFPVSSLPESPLFSCHC